jgi:hypothetical protein
MAVHPGKEEPEDGRTMNHSELVEDMIRTERAHFLELMWRGKQRARLVRLPEQERLHEEECGPARTPDRTDILSGVGCEIW